MGKEDSILLKHIRRLGPKRANKIRRMFLLPKHSDNLKKKSDNNVKVDRWDVTRYVVRRQTKDKDGKQRYKAPKIQRLITHARLRRKKVYKVARVERAKKGTDGFKSYVDSLKKQRTVRRERSASGTGRPKPTN